MLYKYLISIFFVGLCVRGHPSRLKILPGLAFYRTDEGHDDSDNSLMDKDKDLLKSMWNIVDKMDNKAHPVNPTHYNRPLNNEETTPQVADVPPSPVAPVVPTPFHKPLSSSSHHGPGSHRTAAVGTPITTINVYSTYPAAARGETPFTTFHHGIPFHGATPFSSSSDISSRPRESRYNTNLNPNSVPNHDTKDPRNNFNPFNSNQLPFEQPSTGPSPADSLISPSQYESMVNSGMSHNFEEFAESSGKFDSNQNDDTEPTFNARFENTGGSSPLQYLYSQKSQVNPLKSNDDIMQDNYRNLNADIIRPHMAY